MGMFSWMSRLPKRAGGYGKKVINADELKKNADFIVDMASSLPQKTNRSETFENAYMRLGLTEEDLKENYKTHEMRFNIFLGFGTIGVLFMGYYLFNGEIFSFLSVLAFLAICLSQIFTASFRMYQIRCRELVTPKQWFNHKEEWWPRQFVAKKSGHHLKVVRKK